MSPSHLWLQTSGGEGDLRDSQDMSDLPVTQKWIWRLDKGHCPVEQGATRRGGSWDSSSLQETVSGALLSHRRGAAIGLQQGGSPTQTLRSLPPPLFVKPQDPSSRCQRMLKSDKW